MHVLMDGAFSSQDLVSSILLESLHVVGVEVLVVLVERFIPLVETVSLSVLVGIHVKLLIIRLVLLVLHTVIIITVSCELLLLLGQSSLASSTLVRILLHLESLGLCLTA